MRGNVEESGGFGVEFHVDRLSGQWPRKKDAVVAWIDARRYEVDVKDLRRDVLAEIPGGWRSAQHHSHLCVDHVAEPDEKRQALEVRVRLIHDAT